MLKIGITGGIGSGKSTVARVFEVLSIPVYRADDAAKRLMAEDPGIRQAIVAAFGEDSYEGTRLNREFLAREVFQDERRIATLNRIVHPAVIRDAARWFSNQKGPYALKEAALIFESGAERDLDYVIGVKAPLELRLRRSMDRDHLNEAEVRARMEKQMDESTKLARCDYVIVNDEVHLIIPQILELHQAFIKKGQKG
ncbi:MAG: dephospho-CoA kinase [Bacteroidota bacterium]|nr:dephospho-CoA kinase [Bacteroidota bacterium]